MAMLNSQHNLTGDMIFGDTARLPGGAVKQTCFAVAISLVSDPRVHECNQVAQLAICHGVNQALGHHGGL